MFGVLQFLASDQLRDEERRSIFAIIFCICPSTGLILRMFYQVLDSAIRDAFFSQALIDGAAISFFIAPFFYLGLAMMVDFVRNKISSKNSYIGEPSILGKLLGSTIEKDNCLKKQKRLAADDSITDLPIQASRISKIFKTPTTSFYALKDASIVLNKNETLGLLGPNGAGKSTLFNTLSTFHDRTAGKIKNFGRELDTYSSFFKETGICPQDNILWDTISIKTQFKIMRMFKGIPSSVEDKWLDYLELSKFGKRKPSELSSGMQRKVCFLISAIANPAFKFLDEATTGLDPLARKRFREIVEKQKSVYGGSSVFTTHTMSEAEKMCDRIAILVNGSFAIVDSVENIKNQSRGYNLTLYKNSALDNGEEMIGHVLKAFPDLSKNAIVFSEENLNRVVFGLFGFEDLIGGYERLIKAMNEGAFKDFDLCRKNMDDVILAMSRHQRGKG